MNQTADSSSPRNPVYGLAACVVIAIATVGYFVGLQSPMNPELTTNWPSEPLQVPSHDSITGQNALPATDYGAMRQVMQQYKSGTRLAEIQQQIDPTAEIQITSEEKAFALQMRDRNRAFNGAPPTIPHPVDQMSADSCLACHGEGIKLESLRVSKMSHQFLANCTQCHVENSPRHMPASLFVESTFVGLPAPEGGPRAYEGAPPMIPHSTWMRVDCMSCHGLAGPHGIRTTHPWRQNCQQCHAPSSNLEQTRLEPVPGFLPPPEIDQ